MKMKRGSVFEIMSGVALVAACSGKLSVDDTANKLSDGGNGTGGAAGSGASQSGDAGPSGGQAGTPVGGGGAGGLGLGGDGGFIGTGGAGGFGLVGGYGGAGGSLTGGSAGCYSGPEEAGGMYGTGGQANGSVPATCPLDANGFATANLDDICSGSVEWANGSPYPCPASSADLTKGLDCSTDVTTDHTGFTRTVGCGFETIEFQSYELRAAYDLQHEYAASYDLSTGKLSGLAIQETSQFGPCMSYAYKAGALPPDCPSAVTYKCTRIPQGNSTDAAYAGCRSPDEPGCAQCCTPDPNGPDCTAWTAGNGATIYNTGWGQSHACACGCKPCAQCKLEDERNIRLVVPHPECNCSLPPMGEPCASWCNNFLPYRDSTCPGL